MRTLKKICALAIPVALACALLLPIGSGAAETPNPRVKPGAGYYEAAPKKLPNVVYQLGAFAVVNEGGKRRIVSSELYQGIFYPDLGKCDDYNVPLTAESIPITKKGRFSIRDSYPVKGNSVLAVWKGSWRKPNKVVGTLKISFKDCRSKFKWVGKRAAGPSS